MKCGTGGAAQTPNGMKTAMAELTLITGQSPVKKKATKEIQSFKGNAKSTYKMKEQAVVTAVTLRGNVSCSDSYFLHDHPFPPQTKHTQAQLAGCFLFCLASSSYKVDMNS